MSGGFTVFWGRGAPRPLHMPSDGSRPKPFEMLVEGHVSGGGERLVPSGGDSGSTNPADSRTAGIGLDLDALQGEYSICVWDEVTRTLRAGHDPLGLRSLFYVRTDRGCLLSNSLADLLPFVADRALDTDYLNYFMNHGSALPGHTPYRSVSSLRPGERLAITGGKEIALSEGVQPIPSILSLPREDDYVDALEHVLDDIFEPLRDAVHPILCEVSGGLDSALVYTWARKYLNDDFSTVSTLYPGTQRGDETEWVDQVLRGFSGKRISVDGNDIPFFTGTADCFFPEPCFHLINAADFQRTRAIYNSGYGAVLTGLGGDSVFFGDSPAPLYLADLVRTLRLGDAVRLAAEWQKSSTPYRSALWWLVVYGLKPLLSGHSRPGSSVQPQWIVKPLPTAAGATLAKAALKGSFLQNYLLSRIARYAANIRLHYDPLVTGIPYRFPLLDRRLIEFSLSLPHERTFRGGHDRLLHRRVLARAGQAAVAARRGKSGPEELLYKGLRASSEWRDRLSSRPVAAEIGLVDATRWAAEVELVSVGFSNSMFHFETTAALEAWLQGLDKAPALRPLEV